MKTSEDWTEEIWHCQHKDTMDLHDNVLPKIVEQIQEDAQKELIERINKLEKEIKTYEELTSIIDN